MARRATTVSGDYVQGSFSLLDHAGERARAALYFSRFVCTNSFDGNLELARRYLRAALSEFRSIFDLPGSDLKSLDLVAQWKTSPSRSQLDSDPIVSVLRKVRDFAVHSQIIVGEQKTFRVVSSGDTDGVTSSLPAVVIEPLNRAALKANRGKDELSQFNDECLSVFNQHASAWPADMLVHIAIFRTSEYLAAFLSTNSQNVSEPDSRGDTAR